jgi:hypothetical protein
VIAALLHWLVGLLGQKALDWAYPKAAAEREALIKRQDEQAVKDEQTKADSAVIEQGVIDREVEIDAGEKVVGQNAIDIANARNEAAGKLKQIEDAETIEEVLNIK